MTYAISPINFSFLEYPDLVLQKGVENTPKCCTGRKKPSANPSISNARQRKVKVGILFSFDTTVGIEENLVLTQEVA